MGKPTVQEHLKHFSQIFNIMGAILQFDLETRAVNNSGIYCSLILCTQPQKSVVLDNDKQRGIQ